jgi:hypothetical protein
MAKDLLVTKFFLMTRGPVILLDSGVLGLLCNPNHRQDVQELWAWFQQKLEEKCRLCSPDVCAYEVRRGLCLNQIKTGRADGLNALDRFVFEEIIQLVSTNREIVKLSSELWAESKIKGIPTAPDNSLDIDIIICATHRWLEGEHPDRQVVTVTKNVRHLSRFINAVEWQTV